MQAVNEMERMALHKNNNESAPLSAQDTRDNIFDEWTGETSELPTWNPSETEIQSGMVNPQPKSLVKNIVVTLVARPSLVQEILKPMYEPILVRNRTNATAVIRSLPTSRLSIVT